VAPLDAFQLKVGVAGTLVAPFGGALRTGAEGAATSVVNDEVAE
jgi:hypothetical protein